MAACAEAMLRELSVVHERKDQYVLMERAFQLVAEAVEGGQVRRVWCAGSVIQARQVPVVRLRVAETRAGMRRHRHKHPWDLSCTCTYESMPLTFC